MSTFAYKDAQRLHRVEAVDAQPERGDFYFCPQDGCGARLFLVRAKMPYFSANKDGYPHVKNCIYATSNFDHSKYNKKDFIIEDFINSFMSKSANTNTESNNKHSMATSRNSMLLPIRTLKTLYRICKSLKKDELIGNSPVYKILLDDRTFDDAPFENRAFRLIECSTKTKGYLKYDKDRLKVDDLQGPKSRIRLALEFEHLNLYKKVKDDMYKHRTQSFVVAGFWEKDAQSDSYVCKVINNKQVFVIKRNTER